VWLVRERQIHDAVVAIALRRFQRMSTSVVSALVMRCASGLQTLPLTAMRVVPKVVWIPNRAITAHVWMVEDLYCGMKTIVSGLGTLAATGFLGSHSQLKFIVSLGVMVLMAFQSVMVMAY